MSNQPRDSPSVTFQVDPHLKNIYNKEQFGVVLVAAWPPNKSFLEGYDTFINKVKECFDPIDLMLRVEDNDDDDDHDDVQEEESVMKQGETDVQTKSQMSSPNVYLYPPQHLHITVATFHPFSKPFNENIDTNATDKAAGIRTDKVTDTSSSAEKNHELYSKACQKITQNAMQRSDWPKYRFNIEVEGAQIGEKAGIILWKDASSCNKDKQYGDEDTDTDKDEQGQQDQQKHKQQQGGSFHLMRNILKEEYEKAMMDVMPMTDKNGRTSKTTTDTRQNIPKGKELIIPNIIHSTFLRFGSKPQTNGKVIQDKFQSLLHENHNMTKVFLNNNNNNRSGICIDGVKLVVENRAYMHIPFDKDHVLESFELA